MKGDATVRTGALPAAPTADRIVAVDALRGFALLGILLANLNYWSGWIFMSRPERVALAGAQGAALANLLDKALIDGKFYTLFSLLFGVGFSLQLASLERRGADALRLFRRRLGVLLGFGLIHLVFVWDGDILTLYAVLGFTLPWFRRASERTLLMLGAALLLLPVPGVWLFKAQGWAPQATFVALSEWIARQLGGTPGQELAWLRRTDLAGFISWTLSGWPYRLVTILESWRLPKVLGIMLVGMVVGRRLSAGTLLEDRRLLWGVLLGGLALGVPASMAYALDEEAGQASVAAVLGTAPLGFAYATAFLLAWRWAAPGLRVLAAPGRMALTNYLLHTALGIGLFYGIGAGQVGHLAPLGVLAIGLAIYAGQVLGSNVWLRHFPSGPMEALWRRLTYGPRLNSRPDQPRRG